jgi:peptide/nickel transport system substrate-binding protein
MLKRVALLLLVLMLLATVGLTGCKREPAATDPTPTTPQSPARTSLTVFHPGDSTTLNPVLTASAFEARITRQMFNGLTRTDNDFNILPDLATRWDISPDGLVYTFYLREGVKFHNGAVLKASDVKFSFDTYLAEPRRAGSIFMIDKTEVVNDQTVKVFLKFPYGSFLDTVAGLYILPEAAYKAAGESFGVQPVGTGAYRLKQWRQGQDVQMTAFADYYKGEAKIKDLTFKIILDANSAYIALETGDIDFYAEPSALDYGRAKSNTRLATQDGPSILYYYLGLNTDRISDLRVRQAINYAANLEEMNIVATEGTGIISRIPLLETAEGYTTDYTRYEFNPEKARQLLRDAGKASGLKLKFTFIESDSNKKIAQVLQANLAAVGIELELQPYEMGAWFNSLATGDYDITRGGMQMTPSNTDYSYNMMFHSKGFFNISKYADERLDKVLDDARREADAARRHALFQEVSRIITAEALFVPNYWTQARLAYDKDLLGVKLNSATYYDFHDFSWKGN